MQFSPGKTSHWKTTATGMKRLAELGRVAVTGKTLSYKRYWDDFPVMMINSVWQDIGADADKAYVVQTPKAIIARCVLMTTDPGDLVLDPTCGSGTTAYVAEQWGRRWITIDTSRVPLALARQRLLTATFPYYELQDSQPRPGRRLRLQAAAELEGRGGRRDRPARHAQVDRERRAARRGGARRPAGGRLEDHAGHRAVRRSRRRSRRRSTRRRRHRGLRRAGGRGLPRPDARGAAAQSRPPARRQHDARAPRTSGRRRASLYLSAEAALDPDGQPVAIVFGPENGAVSEKLDLRGRDARRTCSSYEQLLVIGFAIEPNAREFVDKVEADGRHPGRPTSRRRPTS